MLILHDVLRIGARNILRKKPLFRTNKSYLYFVNNDSSFHSKYFIKFHQFIDNNNFFKLNNVWLIFDTPFFATFSHIQKYAAEFEH